MTHYGYDGSSNNPHPINYQAVVADLRARGGGAQPFVFIKATEATGYTNPYYNTDIAGFRAAGAAVGAYLFDHGTAVVAAEDAYFRSVVGNAIPGADDMEDPQGVNYVAHTAQLLQVSPNRLVYLNQSEVAQGIPTGAGLWLAEYDGNPSAPPRYPCLIKQYTSSGTVAGIGGQVDLNVWCGTEAQFVAFFGGTTQEIDMDADQDNMLRDIHEQLCGGGSRAPFQFPGWPSEVDPAVKLTLVDFIRAIDGALNKPQTSHVPGSTVQFSPLTAAMNSDAFGYELSQTLAKLSDQATQILALLAPKPAAGP